MVVEVRFAGSDDVERFLLGSREDSSTTIEVYSANSPIGRAIDGREPGETVSYQLPNGRSMTLDDRQRGALLRLSSRPGRSVAGGAGRHVHLAVLGSDQGLTGTSAVPPAVGSSRVSRSVALVPRGMLTCVVATGWPATSVMIAVHRLAVQCHAR